MKEQYLLKSRYGTYSVLNQINDRFWHFIPCPGPFRVIQSEDGVGIEAIDPSGGPFIGKGFDLGDAIVESILMMKDHRISLKLKKK